MTPWPHAARRVLFAAFAIYLVMTVTFGFVALTKNPKVAVVAHGAANSQEAQGATESEKAAIVNEAVEEYKEEHGLAAPVHERYVRWLIDVATLDWGQSYTQNAQVTTVLERTIPTTLAYVLPAMAFALVGGVGLGVYSALNPGTRVERLLSGGFYLGYGIPNYWLAIVVLLLGGAGVAEAFVSPSVFRDVVLPAGVLGTSLLAGQLRYARAESSEYVNTEFVKLVRAKGASTRRVGWHVLRNAALPLVSLFFADLLGVLVVNVFVLETVLDIGGIGGVGLIAVQQRDMPLILGVAMVIAFAGIVGNLLQDLAYVGLDPRVDGD